LEGYRKTLTTFHTIAIKGIQKNYSIFDIVLVENKKYVKVLTEKNIRQSYEKDVKKEDKKKV
jgi:hypothetical protein